jgi:hypothetical protein
MMAEPELVATALIGRAEEVVVLAVQARLKARAPAVLVWQTHLVNQQLDN